MDLSLPVMDGWEATRRLKADKATAGIPIVALTGHALAGILEGAKNAGCDAFVTKPCLPEDLGEGNPESAERPAAATKKPAGAASMRKPTASAPQDRPAARPRRRPVRPSKKARKRPCREAGAAAAGRRVAGAGGARRAHHGPARSRESRARRQGAGRPDAAPASASRGKYVYCIIEASEPLRFGPVGIGSRSV